jgi:hypothetical protein
MDVGLKRIVVTGAAHRGEAHAGGAEGAEGGARKVEVEHSFPFASGLVARWGLGFARRSEPPYRQNVEFTDWNLIPSDEANIPTALLGRRQCGHSLPTLGRSRGSLAGETRGVDTGQPGRPLPARASWTRGANARGMRVMDGL